MKYIGENAITKLISLIKGDLATKQDSIAATGVLERDTTGAINGVETVGATLVETQEATLVDVPNGLLKGDGTTISAAVAGTDYVNSNQAIRYDAAQTITDEQKTQARENIGAVDIESLNRIGTVIGLCGWNQIIPAKTSVNAVTDTRDYLSFVIQAYLGNAYLGVLFNVDRTTPGKIAGIFTSNYDCNRVSWKHSGIIQDIPMIADIAFTSAQIKAGDKLLVSLDILSANPTVVGGLSTDNQMLINLTELFGAGNEPSSVDEFRAIFGATYYPYYDYPTAITKNGIVEYLNPPMEQGIEYRTTERYLGKPVYCKVVDCGNLPAPGSLKNVSHGVSGCLPIMVTGQMSNKNTIPWKGKYTVSADNINIVLYSPADESDFSNLTATAILKYTKNTD